MTRWLLALVAVAVAASGLAGCGGSSTPPLVPGPCIRAPKPHGALCLTIVRRNGKVTDVIGELAVSGPALAGKTWRLALGFGQSGSLPTQTHQGDPPPVTYCSNGQINTTMTLVETCGEWRETARASRGDFPGFEVPRASIPEPLCLHEQVQRDGSWVEGPATPTCAS